MIGPTLIAFLIASAIWVLILLVCREIFCWYWKINQRLAILTEIRDLLAGRTGASNSGNASKPSRVQSDELDALESRNAAKRMATNGYTVEQISKELQKWRRLSPAKADELAKNVKSEHPI